MVCIENLLLEEIDIKQRYRILLDSIQILEDLVNNLSYSQFIDDMLPLIEKIIENYIDKNEFCKDDVQDYIDKYKVFSNEILKYQVWLVGTIRDCCTVRSILNNAKVHICGESRDSCIEGDDNDYIIICSRIGEDEVDKIENSRKGEIVRYDYLKICSYEISPETGYLDIRLRNKIETGVEGAVTGLSYVQRGINYDKIERNIACLAAPSIDLYLDFQNFKWLYNEVVVKRKGLIKYCIIGMDFYRLWYDMSLTSEKGLGMLCFYKRLRCIHHYYQGAKVLLKSEEASCICEDIMVENYMDLDFQNTVHPELVQWIRTDEYRTTDEIYKADSKEVMKIFHKPYPLTFKENVKILESFMKFLAVHDIKTLIFIPPFTKVFNDFTDESMKQTTWEVLAKLNKKYEFDILDLSTNEMFTERYFADWSHLNGNGADLATQILNDHMNKIWGSNT